MRTRGHESSPVTLFSFQDIITSVMGIMILVMLVIVLELVARQLQSPVVQQAIVQQDVREALRTASERLERIKQAIAAGSWDDLATLNRGEIQQQSAEFEQHLPILEQQQKQAEQRLEQLHLRQRQAERELADRHSDEASLQSLQEELAALEEELSRLTSSTAMFFRPSQTGGKQAWLVEISADSILAAVLGPPSKPISFAGTTAESRKRQFMVWASGRDASREYFVLFVKPGGVRQIKGIEKELRSLGYNVGLDLVGHKQMPIDPDRGAPIFTPFDHRGE